MINIFWPFLFAVTCANDFIVKNVTFNNSEAFIPSALEDKSDQSSCSCGKFRCGLTNRESRILSGSVTEKSEYPWIAYLTYRGKLYCGASLVNDRQLVTAAHCIHRVKKERVIIHLGKHERNESKYSEQILKAKNWTIHPEFDRRTFKNDIGIIELEVPVKINKFIRPICLPTQDGEYIGQFGTVVGWGRMSESGKSSAYPRKIKVPIMSNKDCRRKKYRPEEITENMFCAGYELGKIDACQGDSGGPLMLEIRGPRGQTHYELTGIVSWGQGCGRSGYPGVYTRVAKYIKFFKENIQENCYCL